MNDLELLREIFKDARLHVGLGTIAQLGMAADGSALRVMVNLLPENRQIVAQMTFADVYSVTIPEIDDLAVVVFVDGHPDDAWVLKLCNTNEEPIPLFARAGNTMIAPRQGRKVGIGRSTAIPTEPLVLGTVLQTLLTNVLAKLEDLSDKIANHAHIGNLGYQTSIPLTSAEFLTLEADFLSYKESPVQDGLVLSDIAFTEKGSL